MNTSVYAGFWRRVAAFIIDTFLAALPAAIICMPLLFWRFYTMANAPETEYASQFMIIMLLIILWQILGLASFWLYFAFMESGPRQATWGKRLLKIKVVGKDGGRISFSRATGRAFSKWLSSMIMYIGFIMAGLTNRKRALHDYIVDTYVVRDTFQLGDELPETPSHPWWLAIISALIVFGWLGLMLFSSAMSLFMNPGFQAAVQLQNLANQGNMSYGAQTLNGITYSVSQDGYRASFGDYTLYLPDAESDICCMAAPGADCDDIGFDAC